MDQLRRPLNLYVRQIVTDNYIKEAFDEIETFSASCQLVIALAGFFSLSIELI